MGIPQSKPFSNSNHDVRDFDQASPARHTSGPGSDDYDNLLNSLQGKDQPHTNWQDFSIKDRNIGDVSKLVDELNKAYPNNGWKSVAITLNGVTTFLRSSEVAGPSGLQFIVPKEAKAAYEKDLPQDIPAGKWVDYEAHLHDQFFQRLLSHFATEIRSERRSQFDEQAHRPYSRAAHDAGFNALRLGEAGIHVQPAEKNLRSSEPAHVFPDYWSLNDGHANNEIELNDVRVQPNSAKATKPELEPDFREF